MAINPEYKAHRVRLRKIFSETGLEGFDTHNVIDLMLTYSTRSHIDSKAAAKRIADRYGSISNLFDCPVEALYNHSDISKHTAIFFKMFPEIFRYMQFEKIKGIRYIKSSDEAVNYLKPYFAYANEEVFTALYLNKRNKILKVLECTQGNSNAVSVNFRIIIRDGLNLGADKIIIAHNHPDGFAIPSNEDLLMTQELAELCTHFSFRLYEHIIYSSKDYTLLSGNKWIKRKKILTGL